MHDEPSNDELGIKRYPWWVLIAVWVAAFLGCVYVWQYLLSAIIEAVRTA